MAKLPSVADLGPAPAAPGERPIGQIDGSAYGRGLSALGQGLAKAGGGLQDIALDKTRYDYATQSADTHAKLIAARATFRDDPDYATAPDRWAKTAQGIIEDGAKGIDNPAMADRFRSALAVPVASETAGVQHEAFLRHVDVANAYRSDLGSRLIQEGSKNPDSPLQTGAIDAYNAKVDADLGAGLIPSQAHALAEKRKFAQSYGESAVLWHASPNGGNDPQGALNVLRAPPGSDPQLAERIVQVESGGNPTSRSKTSSAYGAAQFLASRPGGDNTWNELLSEAHPELVKGKSLDEINALRADPNLSREVLTNLIAKNRSYLQNKGIEATPGALYLAHFAGPKGAAAILQADPNQPVADVLAKAVGPDMAQKMIAANQSVLGGRLAGSVAQWADSKMGGGGSGKFAEFIAPERRLQLIDHISGMARGKVTGDIATFNSAVNDDVTEAMNTGSVKEPKTQEDFIARYGPEHGPGQFHSYQANLQLGSDIQTLATKSDKEIDDWVKGYEPKTGAEAGDQGYAEQTTRQGLAIKAAQQVRKQRSDDPAAFAISRLPVVQDAYQKLGAALGDKTATDADRQAAAKDFAAKMDLEQERIGIPPEDRRLFPQSYVDKLSSDLTTSAQSEDPKARAGIVSRIQQEAQLWGDRWPQMYRQLAPKVEPLVRVIASGVDQQAAVTLANLADKDTKALLKEQDETKASDLHKAIVDEFRPFTQSVAGSQSTQTIKDFMDQGEKLAAFYVSRGQAADEAAGLAFKQLIGNHYSFQGGYRIPKSVPYQPGDISAGAAQAKDSLDRLDIASERDDRGGLSEDYLAKHTADAFRRDGKWITAPDESGLALVYGDQAVRRKDGSPLVLPWKQLSDLALDRAKRPPIDQGLQF